MRLKGSHVLVALGEANKTYVDRRNLRGSLMSILSYPSSMSGAFLLPEAGGSDDLLRRVAVSMRA